MFLGNLPYGFDLLWSYWFFFVFAHFYSFKKAAGLFGAALIGYTSSSVSSFLGSTKNVSSWST